MTKEKIMKLTGIITGIILMLSVSVHAQPPHKQRQHHEPPPLPNDEQISQMVDNLAEQLGLNKEKKIKVLKLYQAYFTKVEENQKAAVERQKMERAEMKKLRKTFQTDVELLLTEDQKAMYKEFLKNSMNQRPNMPPPQKK